MALSFQYTLSSLVCSHETPQPADNLRKYTTKQIPNNVGNFRVKPLTLSPYHAIFARAKLEKLTLFSLTELKSSLAIYWVIKSLAS